MIIKKKKIIKFVWGILCAMIIFTMIAWTLAI